MHGDALVTWYSDQHIFFVGDRSGSPDSMRVFNASLACFFTAFKSVGELVSTTSLNGVNILGIEGQLSY